MPFLLNSLERAVESARFPSFQECVNHLLVWTSSFEPETYCWDHEDEISEDFEDALSAESTAKEDYYAQWQLSVICQKCTSIRTITFMENFKDHAFRQLEDLAVTVFGEDETNKSARFSCNLGHLVVIVEAYQHSPSPAKWLRLQDDTGMDWSRFRRTYVQVSLICFKVLKTLKLLGSFENAYNGSGGNRAQDTNQQKQTIRYGRDVLETALCAAVRLDHLTLYPGCFAVQS